MSTFRIPLRLRATLARLATVVCPPGLEELGITDSIADHFEMTARTFPAFLRQAMVAGLAAIEAGTVLWPRTLGKPYSRLGAADAHAYYLVWREHPLQPVRKLVSALKSLILQGYYENRVVRERIGYLPDAWVAEVTRRRRLKYGDEVREREAALLAPDPLIQPAQLMRKVRHG